MTSIRGGWPLLASLPVALVLAAGSGCDGHLDFRAKGGPAGVAGGGTGGAGGCASDAECRLSSLHCEPVSRTCVACVDDRHCGTSGFPRCDTGLHRCVACLVATDCPAGQACRAAHCVTPCADDTTPTTCPAGTACNSGTCSLCGDDGVSCVGSAMPFCLSPPGICAACRTDADCTAPTPRCDPVRYGCVACVTIADCPAAMPFCDPDTGSCKSS